MNLIFFSSSPFGKYLQCFPLLSAAKRSKIPGPLLIIHKIVAGGMLEACSRNRGKIKASPKSSRLAKDRTIGGRGVKMRCVWFSSTDKARLIQTADYYSQARLLGFAHVSSPRVLQIFIPPPSPSSTRYAHGSACLLSFPFFCLRLSLLLILVRSFLRLARRHS